MKKIILSLVAAATLALTSFGQAPEGFKYQAVVRDAGNLILANQAVGVQLTIQQGAIGGTAVYTETFAPTTNAFGLVNLEIGSGTTVDDFTTIDWGNGPFFIETSIDATGGTSYSVMGTSQLMSVPYALYAKTAGSVSGGASGNWALSGTDISKTNTGNVGIGTTTPMYSLTVKDPTLAAVGIGNTSFNQVQSGDLTFGENIDDASGICGFNLHHDGADNSLSLYTGCYIPTSSTDTLFRASRNGYMNIRKLGIGSVTQNPAFPLTVDGASSFDGDVTITGNLNVTGTIAKGGGTFKIDHPQDPENKYLVHSFVESPEMMNIYSGNIVTDADGYATVELPSYFEAANKDFRYQLTVIGTFAQAIVKEKIAGNTFKIQTNSPNVEVSWSVTGVRADKFADANRVVPELEKEHKGTYIHPELYGASSEASEVKAIEAEMLKANGIESNDPDNF